MHWVVWLFIGGICGVALLLGMAAIVASGESEDRERYMNYSEDKRDKHDK